MAEHPDPAQLLAATDPERRSWLRLALSACDAADELAEAAFARARTAERKADGTLVTETDRAIEAAIRARIREAFPDHGLVGEEYGAEAAAGPVRWYLDPIDGTNNFVRGVPIFATLVAAERGDEREVAIVSAPALGRRWAAVRGAGAWVSGREGDWRRLRVSDIGAIEEAHLVTSASRDLRDPAVAPGFDRVMARAWRERGFGDFWGHCLVAEGAAEAMVERGLAAWDIAAPMLVVEEAGGRVSDLEGVRGLERPAVVSSNGVIHDPLLAALRSGAA